MKDQPGWENIGEVDTLSKHTRLATIAVLTVGILYFALRGLPWPVGTVRPPEPSPAAAPAIPPAQLRAALQELLLDRETRALLESLVSEAEQERMIAAVTAQVLASPGLEQMVAGLLEGPRFRQAAKELVRDPELQALIVQAGFTPERILGLVEEMLSTAEGRATLVRLARELLPLITEP
jgi:hypothetical protein